jgi:hypothetical protein
MPPHAAGRLGLVEGAIGFGQQGLLVELARLAQRDADARPERDLELAVMERFGQGAGTR